jgi:CubicO group peptidase (beta-lactamase class C family)
VIYERLVAPDLYVAFQERIAKPLGMEDFDPATDGFRVYEPTSSVFPAHTFRMSARDLLRFGQLYLQRGRWNGRDVVPASWVDESTRPISDLGDGTGYGYLWWTYAVGSMGPRYPQLNQYASFVARGTGGQFILVVPQAGLVIVHRGDTDHGREVAGRDVWRIAEMIMESRTSPPRPSPELTELQPIPFQSQLPANPPPPYVRLDSSQMATYVGEYEDQSKVVARVFVLEGRLFANLPGQGEAELLCVSPDEFRIMPVAEARFRFERDASGRPIRLIAQLGRQTLTATRR